MTENMYTCKCGEGIHSYNLFDVEFFEKNGICQDCYEKDKGLIKVDNHYVPWNYRNHAEIKGDDPADPEYYEDVNAFLPTIEYDEEYSKWKLTFMSADIGGYDVTILTWYFDSKEEILEELLK